MKEYIKVLGEFLNPLTYVEAVKEQAVGVFALLILLAAIFMSVYWLVDLVATEAIWAEEKFTPELEDVDISSDMWRLNYEGYI